MIRRSPCEIYIKYLIVHPDEYGREQIKQRLFEEQLDYIGDDYFEQLRLRCSPPVPFRPFDEFHAESERFMARHGMRRLFQPDPHVRIARKVLAHAKAKEFVESMVLSGAPSMAIGRMVATRFGLVCSKEGIESYRSFFWNTDLIDSTEVRALLMLRIAPHGTKTSGLAFKALEVSGYTDPRRVAASMPSSPYAALLSQMRMGFMPSKIEVAEILECIKGVVSLRLLESAMKGDYKDSTKAAEWSLVLKNVTEVMETVVPPEAGMREQLTQLLLKTDPSSVPLLNALTQGRHTVEMEPAQESHGDAEVLDE